MKDLLAEIAKHLVNDPDQVTVKEIVSSKTIVLKLAVAKQDVGKIIGGKEGNIGAIRTIMKEASRKIHKRIVVELVE